MSKGYAVKPIIIAAAFALSCCIDAQAVVVDIEAGHVAASRHVQRQPLAGELSANDLKTLQRYEGLGAANGMSELPEPEVFLMMLVGLCLIGYRASRDSDEKFK